MLGVPALTQIYAQRHTNFGKDYMDAMRYMVCPGSGLSETWEKERERGIYIHTYIPYHTIPLHYITLHTYIRYREREIV